MKGFPTDGPEMLDFVDSDAWFRMRPAADGPVEVVVAGCLYIPPRDLDVPVVYVYELLELVHAGVPRRAAVDTVWAAKELLGGRVQPSTEVLEMIMGPLAESMSRREIEDVYARWDEEGRDDLIDSWMDRRGWVIDALGGEEADIADDVRTWVASYATRRTTERGPLGRTQKG